MSAVCISVTDFPPKLCKRTNTSQSVSGVSYCEDYFYFDILKVACGPRRKCRPLVLARLTPGFLPPGRGQIWTNFIVIQLHFQPLSPEVIWVRVQISKFDFVSFIQSSISFKSAYLIKFLWSIDLKKMSKLVLKDLFDKVFKQGTLQSTSLPLPFLMTSSESSFHQQLASDHQNL